MDPIQYLGYAGVEFDVAQEVLVVAEEMYLDRRKELVEAIGVAVQNGVVKAFGG